MKLLLKKCFTPNPSERLYTSFFNHSHSGADVDDFKTLFTMKKFLVALLFAGLFAAVPAVVEAAEGSPNGAQMITNNRADSYDSEYHYVTFRANERAIVCVEGDHDTDLDLTIYDENGNEITSHIDNHDVCICSWVPRRTATFTIKVRNYGSVYNMYTLYYN